MQTSAGAVDAACTGALNQLYNKHFSPMESNLGGEGSVAIYGSLTQNSFHELFHWLRKLADAGHVDLTVLVDIGCGLSRPLFHAAVQLKDMVKATFGVEVCREKCAKAYILSNQIAQSALVFDGHLELNAVPKILHVNVEQLHSLAPATHIIAVWEGMNPDAKEAIGKLFRETSSLRGVTVVQRAFRVNREEGPVEVMSDLGFGEVELLRTGIQKNGEKEKLTVYQTGSRGTLQAYTFKKVAANQERAASKQLPPSSGCLNSTPGFDGSQCMQGPTITRSGKKLAQMPTPVATRGSRWCSQTPADQQLQQQQQQQ